MIPDDRWAQLLGWIFAAGIVGLIASFVVVAMTY